MKRGNLALVLICMAALLTIMCSLVIAQENTSENNVTLTVENVSVENVSVVPGTEAGEISDEEVAEIEQEVTEAEQELESELVKVPGERGYGWLRFREKLRHAFMLRREAKLRYELKLARRRLAELQWLANHNVSDERLEELINEYNRTLQLINKRLEAMEQRRNMTELRELVDNMTYKHVLVLYRVLERAPPQARKGLERALIASQKHRARLLVRKLKEEGYSEEEIREVLKEVEERRREHLRQMLNASETRGNWTVRRACVPILLEVCNEETGQCKLVPGPCERPKKWVLKRRIARAKLEEWREKKQELAQAKKVAEELKRERARKKQEKNQANKEVSEQSTAETSESANKVGEAKNSGNSEGEGASKKESMPPSPPA